MDSAKLLAIASRFSRQRILVIGDLMLDEFIWGKVSRISPEAPVPVVDVVGESYYPGGAANVARNLREFTSSVGVMGLTGTDAAGDRLLGILDASGIETSPVQRDAGFPTIVKSRIVARHQQVVRVDRERKVSLDRSHIERALQWLGANAGEIDGIVIADYGKGFVHQQLAESVCQIARERGKILTVDPSPGNRVEWTGVTAVKPNRSEVFFAAGMVWTEPVDPVQNDRHLLAAAEAVLQRWDTKSLLITLGEQGMLLLRREDAPFYIPTRAKEVFDVSGAGDTAIAVFTLGLCAGADPAEAAVIANHASGIAVSKLGTATVTPGELSASLAPE